MTEPGEVEWTHWTLTECFNYFGTRPANIRCGWSARNEATGTVVLTLWTDQLCTAADGRIVYDVRARHDLEWWRRRPGNRERLANLRWAEAHTDGRFRAVIVACLATDAFVRKIVRRYPEPTLVMRLTALHDTGEFRAESVTPPAIPLDLTSCPA
jgi:hypothetical protein